MSITVERKGFEYEISSPPVMEKPKVIKRLMPLIKSLKGLLIKVLQNSKGGKALPGNSIGDAVELISLVGVDALSVALEEFISEFAKLSDEDLDIIFRVMLSKTRRRQGAFLAEVFPNGVQAFADMDIDDFLFLAYASIGEYIARPLQGLLLDSQGEPKQALAT